MFLVGLILLVYAALTFALVERVSRPLTVWMPSRHHEDSVVELGAAEEVAARDPAPRRAPSVLAAGPD